MQPSILRSSASVSIPNSGSHPFFIEYCICFNRRSCSHPLFVTNYFISGMFISNKGGASYVSFQSYYNFFYRRLTVIHFFNDTVFFSDLNICSHPFLPAYFKVLSVYFRTSVTMKQTFYQSSFLFRAASILLKWKQPFPWSSYFLAGWTFFW